MTRFIAILFFAFFPLFVTAQDTTRLSLLFIGDVMQHDSQIGDAWDPATQKYDYTHCFQYVKPYIQAADVAIGNLEVTLGGTPHKGYPRFSAPDELALALKKIGMDVLVTANNHSADRGRKGIERTIEMLDSFNILHTGTFVEEVSRLNDYPLMIQKKGFNLALLNYTYGTNGLPVPKPNIVNLIDTATMRADLVKARALSPDAIIVFMHWGAEYQSLPSGAQKKLAEFCFRNGADLVIGAHPHVLQPMEWRKETNKLLAYSLGNFVSGQRTRYRDGGAMLTVDLEKVTYANDSAFTKIDSAAYVLAWVYLDAKKNYTILPAPAFESTQRDTIREEKARLAFDTFLSDSRTLLGKHNRQVAEALYIPSDTLTTFRVWLYSSHETDSLPVFAGLPYGVDPVRDENGGMHYYSGEFLNAAQADQYLVKLISRFPLARVEVFADGVRKPLPVTVD